MTSAIALPPRFEQIRQDFAFLDDWEDRYRYLIELGRQLEPLPETERSDANKVRGCTSQVWLWTVSEQGDAMHFVGDSDAHIVRGLVAVLIALFDGLPPKDIAEVDAEAALAELELAQHLSSQRSNGLRAMVQRIKADARAALTAAPG